MRAYLEQIVGEIPDLDWNAFQALSYPEFKKKGAYLLRRGKPCTSLWYLKKGAVRKVENVNGVDTTTHFYVAPFLFTVYRSLLRGETSLMDVICEQDCELEVIPAAQLNALFLQSHPMERVGRLIAEHHYVEEFDQRRAFLNMDALQRYEFLEAHQPEIFQYFQLKDIATYLGITPESLSRLRKMRWTNR